ncbi:MAG: anti-sigma factor [Bacillus sp. (in: firmicutes)]
MSDEFKRKLEAYEKGELPAKEAEEIEKDLEKLEQYLEVMEEPITEVSKKPSLSEKKQKKIMKYSKWKARWLTAFSVFGIFIVFTIVSSIITNVFYAWGNPDRSEVYRNIIDYTLTVTDPYGQYGGGGSNTTAYFGMEATRDLNKQVGSNMKKVGEIKTKFLFALMGNPVKTDYGTVSQNVPSFSYPGVGDENPQGWERLEKLPEETVVSAYLSFSKLMDTKEVLKQFEGKNMELIWLAVDTGKEGKEENFTDPIGFPGSPIWFEDDMILDSRVEEKGKFGSGTISESYSSPDYEEGDPQILHQQFMKTLTFLEKYEGKANKLYFGNLELSQRIKYLEKNGFQHYGVVITGPTKEVLKLQKEKWARDIAIDEVDLWNWDR